MTTTPTSLDVSPVKPGSFADRALQLIRERPGLSLTEIHRHLRPNVATMSGTYRDVERLGDLISKRRDGPCVRHYPADGA